MDLSNPDAQLESEALKFFSLPLSSKLKAGPPDPFGCRNKQIGPNVDVGLVEYLLLTADSQSDYHKFVVFPKPPTNSCQFTRRRPHLSPISVTLTALLCFLFVSSCIVNDYLSAVKKMACDILEMLADGLNLQPRNAFSKLLIDEQSDSVFRLNHYPARPEDGGCNTIC